MSVSVAAPSDTCLFSEASGMYVYSLLSFLFFTAPTHAHEGRPGWAEAGAQQDEEMVLRARKLV